jgi:formate--tetrahydrofolate ligase
MAYKTDIEIAQECEKKKITDVAKVAGIDDKYLELYGNYKAKIDFSFLKDNADKKNGKLILVTAITPTPAGEGKTTTSVGLTDGLRAIGKNAIVALREPSLGPVFGVAVSFVKNAINVFSSTTGGVGELSNFLLSASFVFVAGALYQKNRTKKGAVIGTLSGLVASSLFSVITNTLLIYPVYTKIFGLEAIISMSSSIISTIDSTTDIILIFNMPFTFVKGLLNAVIAFILYKPLSPIIRGAKKK